MLNCIIGRINQDAGSENTVEVGRDPGERGGKAVLRKGCPCLPADSELREKVSDLIF